MPRWLALIESIRSGGAARLAIFFWASEWNIWSSPKIRYHAGSCFRAGGFVIFAEKMVADMGAAVAAITLALLRITSVQANSGILSRYIMRNGGVSPDRQAR